jgi:hypothetical protein
MGVRINQHHQLWNNGMMEYWNIGKKITELLHDKNDFVSYKSINPWFSIPSFHYSTIPLFPF